MFVDEIINYTSFMRNYWNKLIKFKKIILIYSVTNHLKLLRCLSYLKVFLKHLKRLKQINPTQR